jgi:hypothetical protein
LQISGAHATVPQDLVQQTPADRFAGMHGHNRTAAGFMLEEIMAAFDA